MGKEQLPELFLEQIESLLGQQTSSFLESYQQPRTYGLRFNELKAALSPSQKQEIIDLFELEPIPWCSEGYYYKEDARPGKHPYHTAGLYYIQEPSAMSAVELLDPKPGERILDLAAAPGGKSSHIASKLQGQGVLISNEIHPERAKILAENVERMGITNAVVTCAAPDELASRFPATFDRIMLDAPCSGEGMFRKDPRAITEWSPGLVDLCVTRQFDILEQAYVMLKPGGTIAYSTCTFNVKENEDMMRRFTENFPDMEIIQMKRLWPHLERGEGHFVAVLHKNEEQTEEDNSRSRKIRGRKDKRGTNYKAEQTALQELESWIQQELPGYTLPSGNPLLFGESLYLLPGGELLHQDLLKGLKIPRAGLHAAQMKKNRIEPAMH